MRLRSNGEMQVARRLTGASLSALLGVSLALAYSSGPPDGKTGRPGEGTCLDCHSGVGSPDSTELTGFGVAWYQPDSVYSLTLSVGYAGQARWGFELTAVDGSNNRIGQLIVTDSTHTQYSSAEPGYLKHTSTGTHPGTPGPTSWTFGWRAPAAGAGPVRFYWCANAANNNGSTSGDLICRDSLFVAEAVGIRSETAHGRLAWRYSNPSRYNVVIRYRGMADGPVRIYSAGGRLIRRLWPQPEGDLLSLRWDGHDQSGTPVSEASYFIRLGREVSSAVSVRLVR
jgi:hypothetical protein